MKMGTLDPCNFCVTWGYLWYFGELFDKFYDKFFDEIFSSKMLVEFGQIVSKIPELAINSKS